MTMFSAMGFGVTAVFLFVLGFVLPLMSLVKGYKRKQVFPCVCGAIGLFFSFFFFGLFPVALILGIVGLVQSGKLPVSETWPERHMPESEPEQKARPVKMHAGFKRQPVDAQYLQDTAQDEPQYRQYLEPVMESKPAARQETKSRATVSGPANWDSLSRFMDTNHLLEFHLVNGDVIRGFVGAVNRKALVIRLETGQRQYVDRDELASFRDV